jgi:hypothetical protein
MATFLCVFRGLAWNSRVTIARKSCPDKAQAASRDGGTGLEVRRPDRHCLELADRLGRTYWSFAT